MTQSPTRISHLVTRGRKSSVVIAACFAGLPERALIVQCLGDRARLIDNRLSVLRTVRKGPCRAILLPPCESSGESIAPIVQRVLAHFPRIRVVILVRASRGSVGVADAVRLGAETLFWESTTDLAVALAGLGRFSQTPAEHVVSELGALHHAPTDRIRDILSVCIRLADQGLSVGSLATQVGESRRALSRRSRRAAWPPPSELIEWGRLFRASMALLNGEVSVRGLAEASGFAHHTALRRAILRHVGIAGDELTVLTLSTITEALRRRLAVLEVLDL